LLLIFLTSGNFIALFLSLCLFETTTPVIMIVCSYSLFSLLFPPQFSHLVVIISILCLLLTAASIPPFYSCWFSNVFGQKVCFYRWLKFWLIFLMRIIYCRHPCCFFCHFFRVVIYSNTRYILCKDISLDHQKAEEEVKN
jgi:hypothetical protein